MLVKDLARMQLNDQNITSKRNRASSNAHQADRLRIAKGSRDGLKDLHN